MKSVDLVQVCLQNGHDKSSKIISPRVVQEVYSSSVTVTIPDSNGQKIISALEDTIVAITDDNMSSHIMESVDKLDADKADSFHQSENDSGSTVMTMTISSRTTTMAMPSSVI